MADKLRTLSKESIELLHEMLQDYRHHRRPLRSPTEQRQLSQSPEVYLAMVTGVLYSVSRESAGSGTGTGTGTGAGQVDRGPVSYQDCQVYWLDRGDATPNFTSAGFTVRVYNFSQSPVYGPKLVPVARDKFGTWLVLPYEEDEIVEVTGGATDNDSTGSLSTDWYPAMTLELSPTTGSGPYTWHQRNLVYVYDANGVELGIGQKGRARLLGWWDGQFRYLASADLWDKGEC